VTYATTSEMLRSLFRANRRRILHTYALTVLENLFNLLYPFATGLAINGLLGGDFSGLALFAGIWLAHAATGVWRQRYDTRTFTHIYRDLATRVVLGQRSRGVPASQIVARSALARELVNFLERDVPLGITALFGFFGSLVMLFLYDALTGLVCLALLAPLVVLNRAFARRALALNKGLNDQLEREVDVLTERRQAAVREHYGLLADWRVRLSDAEATTWGLLEVFIVGLVAFAIVRAVSLPNVEAGTIYSIVAYSWDFVASLGNVPFLVQQLARLRDIGDRVASEGGTTEDVLR
jgi:hypothetical protein